MLALVIIAILGISIIAYMMFFRTSDEAFRVQRLGGDELVDHRTSQFRQSRLYIHGNGTFEIELIRTLNGEHTLEFSGIGTWTRSGRAYTFVFHDCYFLIGTELAQRPQLIGADNSPPAYRVDRNGRVMFVFQGIIYYFGR